MTAPTPDLVQRLRSFHDWDYAPKEMAEAATALVAAEYNLTQASKRLAAATADRDDARRELAEQKRINGTGQ